MKTIPLTKGKVAIIDDADYKQLSQYKWCAVYHHKNWRAIHYGKKANIIKMHHLIMPIPKGSGLQIDHRNGNGLDNRRCNLRICTAFDNQHNQKARIGGTSPYKGVYWQKGMNKWQARIGHNNKVMHLGYFNNETKAAKAYDQKATELFGEFARTNFRNAQIALG